MTHESNAKKTLLDCLKNMLKFRAYHPSLQITFCKFSKSRCPSVSVMTSHRTGISHAITIFKTASHQDYPDQSTKHQSPSTNPK
ncbi:hypothetical protein [Moraxella catarrhalis]|uniref:hypothetical protein n=1 Tax=Moraxella catarrhalis TaxID=480 RepID=UPI00003E0B05|nr:hypothetical protein [Moraxella catarrhalis]